MLDSNVVQALLLLHSRALNYLTPAVTYQPTILNIHMETMFGFVTSHLRYIFNKC